MAAAVATPVTPTEAEPERCAAEEESRGGGGHEAEEDSGGQQPGGPPVAGVTSPHSRLSKLPLARIKALMKADPDVSLASQESVFIIAKATVQCTHSTPPRYRTQRDACCALHMGWLVD